MHRTITRAAIAVVLVGVLTSPATADWVRGGKIYDKWWAVNFVDAPTGDHPLYPPVGQQTGSGTFRCKECHGWDYKGVNGAYGSGSHFTGIPGVLGSTLTAPQMFDIIKNPDGDGTGGTTVNGHDFGTIGLSDTDINDVVEYLQGWLIDMDPYIAANKDFIGDPVQGETNYTTAQMAFACIDCHGPDGDFLNFGTPEAPEWIGTVATANPWELMHKVRVGQPNTAMPSWLLDGGTNQDVADIGRYAQLNFPTGPPAPIPTVSAWGIAAMMLLCLTAATVVFRRPETARAA